MTATNTHPALINGLDPKVVQALIDRVAADPANGQTHWNVVTQWVGGARARARSKRVEIGGAVLDRPWTIHTDEPPELCGTDTQPNPQELLLAGLNACMTVGYAAAATLMGIELESLEIETRGDIDLRGFLALDENVKPGYDGLKYTVRIKSNGTDEQVRQLHAAVQKTSPNYFNFSQPVALDAELVIE